MANGTTVHRVRKDNSTATYEMPASFKEDDVNDFDRISVLWFSAAMFVASFALFVFTWMFKRRRPDDERRIRLLELASFGALYFAFSITLVVYNKFLLAVWQNGEFRFPVLLTTVHMIVKLGCSAWWVAREERSAGPEDAPVVVSSSTWWNFAVPVGVTTGLDVAASNASLFYVTVTLFTVVKSTVLVFVFLFSVLYRLQTCSLKLVSVVCVIFAGVTMASYGAGAERVHTLGFLLVLAASALSGLRWAMTEILMQRIGKKMGSILTIKTVSPAAVISLLPMALWLEGGPFLNSRFAKDSELVFWTIFNVVGSGIFAFLMLLAELAFLHRSSSLTLAVVGYSKQMMQIILGVIIFHDIVTPLNIGGIGVTFLGMFAFGSLGSSKTAKLDAREAAVVQPSNDLEEEPPKSGGGSRVAPLDSTRERLESIDLEDSEAGETAGASKERNGESAKDPSVAII